MIRSCSPKNRNRNDACGFGDIPGACSPFLVYSGVVNLEHFMELPQPATIFPTCAY